MANGIETKYGNTLFRSKLEASYAATFDKFGIVWSYEPEGYETDAGRYLPDFFLENLNTFFEVKGPHEQNLDKVVALRRFIEQDSRAATDSPDEWDWRESTQVIIGDSAGFLYDSRDLRLRAETETDAPLRLPPHWVDIGHGTVLDICQGTVHFGQCPQCQRWIFYQQFECWNCRVCDYRLGKFTDLGEVWPRQMPLEQIFWRPNHQSTDRILSPLHRLQQPAGPS